MAKQIIWYEVYDATCNGLKHPKNNYWLNDYCNVEPELLGLYSTRENARIRLKKWADEKGIPFEKCVSFHDLCTGLDVDEIGLFYSGQDDQVEWYDDWGYAMRAYIVEKIMILDADIQ